MLIGAGIGVPFRRSATGSGASLSSPTVGSLSSGAGTPAVTSDTASGTVYFVVVPKGDNPSAAQIKAGQQSSGAAAFASGSKAAASGVNTFSGVSGLTSAQIAQDPDVRFIQNTAGGDSNIVRCAFFFGAVVLQAFNESGANASTSFADQSSAARALTAVNQAQWSTAQSPAGLSSSCLSDGTADRVTAVDAADLELGAGDFRIRLRVRWAVDPATNTPSLLVAKGNLQSGAGCWFIWWQFSDLKFSYTTDGLAGTFTTIARTVTLAANTWYDIEANRVGNNIRIFLDGVLQGAATDVTGLTLPNTTDGIGILGNRDTVDYSINGWGAAVQVMKGVGGPTAGFTPITLPYQTS